MLQSSYPKARFVWEVPSRHDDAVRTLLRRRYPTLPYSCDAKTMSLQRLIKRRHNEMLQLRRFYNVIATLQRRCNPALSNRKQIQANMSTSDQRCFNFVDQR